MPKKRNQGITTKTDRVVALTGTSEQLGMGLIGLLEADSRYQRVLAVDVRDPKSLGPKTNHFRVDLTTPEAGQKLAEVFRDQCVDTLVHLAFLSNPAHDRAYAHEVQVAGTMHVLNAAKASQVGKVVMLGTTMSYGARSDNPNYLTEDAPLRGTVGCGFIDDLIDVEQQLRRFGQENSRITSTMLRMGARLGGQVDTFMSRLLSHSLVPKVMGFDPLMQLVHEKDALMALKIAVDGDYEGVYNIVAEGVLPYSSIIRMAGCIALPIPHMLAHRLGGFLWAAQATSVPSSFLDYLRYLWVAEGNKARSEMGLVFGYSTRDTLLDYVKTEQKRQRVLSLSH